MQRCDALARHSELAGTFDGKVLSAEDAKGVSLADAMRTAATASIRSEMERLSKKRRIGCRIETTQEHGVTECAPWLTAQMERAVAAENLRLRRLPSGAGHDGMAIRAIADIAMLFVRCEGGISHNPAESITEADAAAGAQVFLNFIRNFKNNAVPA